MGKSANFAKFDGIDGEVYPGLNRMVRDVRHAHPSGVTRIVIGMSKVPNFHLGVGKNGIIGILISLLLPAVQAAREPGSADRKLLTGMLTPSGKIGFAMDDRTRKWIDVLSLPGKVISSYQVGGSSGDPHDKWIDVLSNVWG